jgi:hypothetical protein
MSRSATGKRGSHNRTYANDNLQVAHICRQAIRVASIALLAVAAASTVAQAQAKAAPPIDGILGKVAAVNAGSFDVQTKTGVVHVKLERPLTIYKQEPADLSQVTSNSYVGIATVEQADGSELAQSVLIFPSELKGAAEGSVITGGDSTLKTQSRMTNGSVSHLPVHTSRMTNGTVQTSGSTTLVVNYQNGSQRISVPPNVPVHKVAPAEGALAVNDVVYAATTKKPGGELETNKVFLFVEAASQSAKQ